MSETARAFWTVAPGRGELRNETLPAAGAGEVVVDTLYSGISRGTESTVFHGRVPTEEYQRMRAPFQSGDFPGPLKYGYANVGVVAHGPDDLVGRTVFALYPHQTRYVVPLAAVHVVPDGVPAERAVLAANMETALNGLWDAGLGPGDQVTVVGGGTIGCLVAWLAAQTPGCDVQLVDVAEARRVTAQALGVAFSALDRAAHDRDIVVHASGTSEGLDAALSLAGFEARVVELSWYGDRPVHAALGKAFHAQRLTLQSSQVGHLPASRRGRWTYARRLAMALSLLRAPALDALITGESSFDDLPQTMVTVAGDEGGTLCHRVRYAAAGPSARPEAAPSRVPAMYSVSVRDHFMIAHSFKGDVFGPAQKLHGATYVVDVEFRRAELDADGIVVDIGRATDVLKATLGVFNFQNLDALPEFAGRNTTTEFLARTIFDRIAAAVGAGELGLGAFGIDAVKVTLNESHVAWGAYEGRLT